MGGFASKLSAASVAFPGWVMLTYDPSHVAPLAICGLIGATAAILRWRSGTWSNPSVVFALFWLMAATVPVLGVPEVAPSPYALAYILSAVLAFGAPVALIRWQVPLEVAAARRTAGSSIRIFRSRSLLWWFLGCQCIVVGCQIANLVYQGFDAWLLISDPFRLGCEYLGYRYSGSVKSFAPAQAAVMLNYAAAPVAGMLIADRKGVLVSCLVLVATLVPSFINIVAFADKGTVFLTLAFLFGGLVVGRHVKGQVELVTSKNVIWGAWVLVLVAVALAFALSNRFIDDCAGSTLRIANQLMLRDSLRKPAVSRGVEVAAPSRSEFSGKISIAARQVLSQEELEEQRRFGALKLSNSGLAFAVRSYAFGHLHAFSMWFDDRIGLAVSSDGSGAGDFDNPTKLTFGFWTFMAAGKYLDLDYFSSLPGGYYGEYVLIDGVLQTNIYTAFRGLINDFSIAGSLLFLFVFGALMNGVYIRILLRRCAPVSHGIYVLFAGILYTSYIISVLTWGSVWVVAPLLALLLYWLQADVRDFAEDRSGAV